MRRAGGVVAGRAGGVRAGGVVAGQGARPGALGPGGVGAGRSGGGRAGGVGPSAGRSQLSPRPGCPPFWDIPSSSGLSCHGAAQEKHKLAGKSRSGGNPGRGCQAAAQSLRFGTNRTTRTRRNCQTGAIVFRTGGGHGRHQLLRCLPFIRARTAADLQHAGPAAVPGDFDQQQNRGDSSPGDGEQDAGQGSSGQRKDKG